MTDAFDGLWQSAQHSCLICSPYIAATPVRHLLETIENKHLQETLALTVVTDLTLANLVQGASDVGALLLVAKRIRNAEIIYLPRIHAKVYVVNDEQAIIGSANLTNGGLVANLEYGMLTRDLVVVQQVVGDIKRYATLGSRVTAHHLATVQARVDELRQAVATAQRSLNQTLQTAAAELQREAEDELLRVRVRGRTAHAIFAEAILYVLSRSAMTTEQLHEQIRDIHPDLCDDTRDRVIDGEHFGKLWKHQVRTAQQHLKRQGVVTYDSEQRLWQRVS